MSLYTYRARLTEHKRTHPIYDADTVRLTVDLGFSLTSDLGPCRLFGIAARDFLRDLIEPGQWFTVQTKKDTKGKYGRYLVTIFLDDGTNINELLVETGHAVAREY